MTVAPQHDSGPQVNDKAVRETEDTSSDQNENAVPPVTLRLWNEVAHGIDKNSTGESTYHIMASH